jgi:hypothetical protein
MRKAMFTVLVGRLALGVMLGAGMVAGGIFLAAGSESATVTAGGNPATKPRVPSTTRDLSWQAPECGLSEVTTEECPGPQRTQTPDPVPAP